MKKIEQEQLEIEMMEEMEDEQAFNSEEGQEESMLNQMSMQEAYGSPEPEEKQNAHALLHKAAFESKDTVRTTFLTESELGKPLFNVRFLLDMEDVANYYLNPLLLKVGKDPKQDNRISKYFWEKLQNITSSGMSNKGILLNLNVTRKMDSTRRRVKDNLQPNKLNERR